MKYLTLAITLLLSVNLFAETDSFEMSLSGNFEKDYCSISHKIIYNPSEINTTDPELGYEMHLLTIMGAEVELSCSPGLYDISLTTAEPTVTVLYDKEQLFTSMVYSDYLWNSEQLGSEILHTEYSVNFFDRPSYTAKIYSEIMSLNYDWNTTDPSYNFTVTPIFIFEKK